MVEDNQHQVEKGKTSERHRILSLSEMYEQWYVDYASYVILERAVPDLMDGLKPVQRRILHSMKEIDDGRFNKVANIIGNTMKYHPHGDASIYDALVQLGQKDLLIETQGNWGNIFTGDSAAAPRYIEARLSKFAHEVLFNPKITRWKPSYDGRNNEPVFLPAKFPLLLAQGAEGIAVTLSSKILPHNFNELIDASIKILRNQDFEIYPDFPQGGLIDVSKYNNGLRGGKVRVRARIVKTDSKTLTITEIPYSTTTSSLIDSIIAANEKGKLKIKKIDDNTADSVEIVIHLQPGTNPDQMIDALYAFTDCEITISPNACVIDNKQPAFYDVKTLLRKSTMNTVELLKKELEMQLEELMEKHLFANLEKIFIENKIYRDIEECETWEEILQTIDIKLEPFKKNFYREITRDDLVKLTEIKIKRISRYDSQKADEVLLSIEDDIKEVKHHLENLIDYAINYFQRLKQKYGKGRNRRTEIRNFDVIEAVNVAAANVKLYINRSEGFAGTSLKKDEFVAECSDLDDIIIFREDGTYTVTKIAEKFFVGKNVIHIGVFKKNDENTIYNVIYRDGPSGPFMVKRFFVSGVIRDKEYNLTAGTPNSKVEYLSVNPNGETEVLTIILKPKPKLKKPQFDFDFSQIAVKGRNSKGNILTRHWIKKIVVKDVVKPDEKLVPVWYDEATRRLNTEQRGSFIGDFASSDFILTFMSSGYYCIYPFNLQIHFEDDMMALYKYNPNIIYSAIYLNAESNTYYIKRFTIDEVINKMIDFIGVNEGNKLIKLIDYENARIELSFKKDKQGKQSPNFTIVLEEFTTIKSVKAKGRKLTDKPIKDIAIEPCEAKLTNQSEAANSEMSDDNSQEIENKDGQTYVKNTLFD